MITRLLPPEASEMQKGSTEETACHRCREEAKKPADVNSFALIITLVRTLKPE